MSAFDRKQYLVTPKVSTITDKTFYRVVDKKSGNFICTLQDEQSVKEMCKNIAKHVKRFVVPSDIELMSVETEDIEPPPIITTKTQDNAVTITAATNPYTNQMYLAACNQDGDILARNLTVVLERKNWLSYSIAHAELVKRLALWGLTPTNDYSRTYARYVLRGKLWDNML